MKNRARSLPILAFASLALVLAGCGDDGDDAATTTTVAAEASPSSDMESTEADTDTTEADTETTMADDAEMTAGEPFGPACSSVPMDGEGSFAGMADDPAATAASNNPLLSTLVTAVTEAELVDTLNSDGPFTIFAPVNDAFAAIPEADLAAVLADKEQLTSILTYHVIAGESHDAAALGEAGTAETVNGASLEFGEDGTTVNGVDILCSNVVTANATVHIIGEVLMP